MVLIRVTLFIPWVTFCHFGQLEPEYCTLRLLHLTIHTAQAHMNEVFNHVTPIF